jgi:hypothetical protein
MRGTVWKPQTWMVIRLLPRPVLPFLRERFHGRHSDACRRLEEASPLEFILFS